MPPPKETCPACGSDRHRPFATVAGLRVARDRSFLYLECEGCGSVFLSRATPQPDGIYRAEYFADRKENLAGLEATWVQLGFRLRLRRAPAAPPAARVLDVGCGNGAWLAFLDARGFETHGLDPSEEAVAACRARGLPRVAQGDLRRHRLPPASFDLVTAIHCLEHDPSPPEFVRAAAALVRPGGWLGVAIPNVASWEARRARGDWFHLDPPYHLCLPTPQVMQKIFAAAGLADFRFCCPALDYCQALLYAAGWKRSLPRPLTASALPVAAAWNLALALSHRAGTIEYWGHASPLLPIEQDRPKRTEPFPKSAP